MPPTMDAFVAAGLSDRPLVEVHRAMTSQGADPDPAAHPVGRGQRGGRRRRLPSPRCWPPWKPAHPGFRDRLFDDSGALRRFVNVFVADEDVRFLQGLATPVAEGSTVSIVPAVAGG